MFYSNFMYKNILEKIKNGKQKACVHFNNIIYKDIIIKENIEYTIHVLS